MFNVEDIILSCIKNEVIKFFYEDIMKSKEIEEMASVIFLCNMEDEIDPVHQGIKDEFLIK